MQSIDTKRYNRARIDWKPFFTPCEYSLLDQVLYRTALTHANNGKGFNLHVRTLSIETGVSTGRISQIIKSWPFLKKVGTTKNMNITMDYTVFDTWIVQSVNNKKSGIVQSVNNDCSTIEPISNKEEEVLKKEEEVQEVLNNNDLSTNKGIVHPVNNKKSDSVSSVELVPGNCQEPKALPRSDFSKEKRKWGLDSQWIAGFGYLER